jgi:WD40 repeat protein
MAAWADRENMKARGGSGSLPGHTETRDVGAQFPWLAAMEVPLPEHRYFGKVLTTIEPPKRTTGSSISPDGTRVATDHMHGLEYYLWDAATGRRIAGFKRYAKDAGGLANRRPVFTPDSRYFLIPSLRTSQAEMQGAFTVVDALTGAVVKDVDGPPREAYPDIRNFSSARALAVSADGSRIAVLIGFGYIAIYDGRTFALRNHFRVVGHGENIALSSDGRRVAFNTLIQVKVYDADTGTQIRVVTPHEGGIRDVLFVPDDRHLVTAGDTFFGGGRRLDFPSQTGNEAQELLRVWDLDSGARTRSYHTGGLGGGIAALSLGRNGSLFAIASDGRVIVLWEAGADRPADFIRTGPADPVDISFSADGRKLCVSAANVTNVFELK